MFTICVLFWLEAGVDLFVHAKAEIYLTTYTVPVSTLKKKKIKIFNKTGDRSFGLLFLEVSDFNDNVLQYPVIQNKDVQNKGKFIKNFTKK